ncbi:MAG TPA: hypothetical protein VFR40_01035 [Lapillicoccus sp.]|nr:hypothetical protein [Lapillicoccus sp.]
MTSFTLPRTDDSARRLLAGTAVLVLTDLVGGVIAVGAGVNTWAEAWGPAALLAAPAPMIVGQVVLAGVAAGLVPRVSRRWAITAAGVLAVACLVSVASGFFDGGLGNSELTGGLVAYQLFLLAVTATVGGLAVARAVVLGRSAGARLRV